MASILFIYLLTSIAIEASDVHSVEDVRLEEFARKLDMSGVDVIDRMYENYHNMKRDVPATDSDVKAITDESLHHRVRRSSVILDQVKSARKTGNREELYIRSSLPYKRIQEIYDPTDIVPIALTLDPPHSSMKPPMFFGVSNYRNQNGSYQSKVLILRYNETTDAFAVHQSLDEFAPYELESFSGKINPLVHKNFLSVAGYIENATEITGRKPQVSIYEITPPPHFKFVKIQEFRQMNYVRAMKYIEIGQVTYLFLGMHYHLSRNHQRQYSSPSQLLQMRFDSPSNLFHFHSSLPGSGITDLECFKVRDKTYLTVANYRDNVGRLRILSFVYLYNEQVRAFEMLQYLSTNGARDIEHFTLANEEYLVVANEATGRADNKTFDAVSDVYKLTNGKFELVQKLTTYGAIKWKSIPVPNCKQDVLLVYSDQRDNIDQVGIYTFSHTAENFSAAPFSIYHLDLVNSTFRPKARAVSAYSLQDLESGSHRLFLLIGATDTSQGKTIYKLSYDINLVDSPLDAFKRDVERQLNNLNATLNAVRQLLAKAKAALEDAVTKSGAEKITGTKTIYNNVFIKHATVHTLNITEGGMFHIRGNRTYRPGSLGGLEDTIVAYNTSMTSILGDRKQFMYADVDQNVTAALRFTEIVANNVVVNTNVTVASNIVNNVNISHLDDIVKRTEDAVVTGYKKFSGAVTVDGSVVVDGTVNGLDFSRDLVVQRVRQNITALKTFTRSVNVTKDFNTGKINGVDVRKDALFVNKPAVVGDWKTFTSDVACGRCSLHYVNGLDMKSVLGDRVTKSSEQSVTGAKTFKRITSNGNVVVNGKVNGVDVVELHKQLKASQNISVIYGDKIFSDNITVTESIIVDNGINNLSFPGDVLLKSSTQVIHASKKMTGEIHFLKNVNVKGKIDGMDTKDFVTLDTNQVIHGYKILQSASFVGDLHLANKKTVNGIDLNLFAKDIVTTTDDEILSNLTFLDSVVIKNSSIKHLINNDTLASFQDVFNSCLHRSGNQTINTDFKITNNITVNGNLTARLINGFSFPADFASTTANQTFSTDKTFAQDVVMNDVVVNGTVNGVDIAKFNEDVVTDGNGTIYGVKVIYGNVFVNGSLLTDGKINGLNFSEELLFYEGEQDITSHKFFKSLNFSKQLVEVRGDLGVKTTIDGVDLSELDLSGMTVSKNETITGMHCFESADYNRSVQFVNNIDLSALRDDIVTINMDEVIRSEKIFERIILEGNLNTTSTIDGVDVSQLKADAVLVDENAVIGGDVAFNRSVTVIGNLSTQYIDDTRMESIRDDFVSLSADVHLENLTVAGNVFASTLNATSINGVSVKDIVYRSKEQVITGHKEFANVSVGKLYVSGDINGVNLAALRKEVLLVDGNHTIDGEKVFKNGMEIEGNLDASGFVNNIDLRNWGLARSSGNLSQVIRGRKTLVGRNVTVHDLHVYGTVNNDNITSLFDQAVMSNENDTVDHVVFDNDVHIHGDLTVNGSVDTGLLQDVNLTELDRRVLKTVGDQEMSGKVISGHITVGNMSLTGNVNGLDIEDFVTKGTMQIIKGRSQFQSLKIVEDVTVNGFVNDVNITEFATDTLMKNRNSTQLITGNKTFAKGVQMDDVTSEGLVDGLNMTRSAFVTLHTKQVVYGRKHFTEEFSSKRLDVASTVVGVNLAEFNRSRVLLSRDQTITSNLQFADDLYSDENIQVSKLVNNVDLSEFNQVSPMINESDLTAAERWLNNTLENQCKSLTHIKKSLQLSAFRFDYFLERLSVVGVNIHHTEFFTIGATSFLAYSVSGNRLSHCANSMISRWNPVSPYLTDYQPIATSGALKMVYFRTAWNDHYVLIVNSKGGCPGVDGPSQLHKWNTNISKFELATPLPTTDAVDAVVYQTPTYVILFITNANDTLSTWMLTATGTVPYSTMDDNPVTAHIVTINQVPHVAVASRPEKTSSSSYVNIYGIKKGNMTRMQSIASRGASSVTSFTANGVVYLVIANDHGYSADGHSTYHLTVDVYSYSNATNSFEWFRSIPAYRAYRVATYQIGSFVYLAIVHYDKSVSFYEFVLELGFDKVDELYLGGVRSVTYMEVFEKRYVFVASSRQVPPGVSKLVEIAPTGADRRKVRQTIAC